MRIILSNHHNLKTPEAQGAARALYEYAKKTGTVSNTEISVAVDHSLKFFDQYGHLPDLTQLSEVGFSPLSGELTEEKLLYRIHLLEHELQMRAVKKNLLELATEENSAKLLEGIKTLHNQACKEEECEESRIVHVEDMSYDEITKEPSYGVILKSNVRELDAAAHMSLGSVATVFAGPSHGKSMFAVNFTYLNTIQDTHNALYLSLEIPKSALYFQLLSRHSYQMDPQRAVPYRSIKDNILTSEQKKFLKEAEVDFKAVKKGSLRILDVSDGLAFNPVQFGEFLEARYAEEPFDLLVFDYLQLVKYFVVRGLTDMELMNKLVSTMRQKSVSIGGVGKILVLLLSQANRESIKKADKNNGAHSITGLAEVNDLERSSQFVISLYLNDILKASGEVKYCLLKNRDGPTLSSPQVTFMDPTCSVIGETSVYNEVFSEDSLQLVEGTGDDLSGIFGQSSNIF